MYFKQVMDKISNKLWNFDNIKLNNIWLPDPKFKLGEGGAKDSMERLLNRKMGLLS